ncbi:MAG: protein kinase [Xenococcus sp. (in: cyanobacteria)]
MLSLTGDFEHIYLAKDTKDSSNNICVVKQLKSQDPYVFNIAEILFFREAEILEDLGNHSQIIRLLAYFAEAGEFYLVEEYIKPRSRRKILILNQLICFIYSQSFVK